MKKLYYLMAWNPILSRTVCLTAAIQPQNEYRIQSYKPLYALLSTQSLLYGLVALHELQRGFIWMKKCKL